MKRKITIQGEMGEKFGNSFEIEAKRPSDVFQCLDANFPEFKKYIVECHENDVGFIVDVGDKNVEKEEDLMLSLEEGDILITPAPIGSKSGLGKILAAIAIVAFIAFLPATGAFATTIGGEGLAAGLTTFGTVLAGVAVNLALTGLQQIMAPDPSVDSNQDESYLFNGQEQNIIEGDPVPVLYGRLKVPGRPISFEMLNRKFTGANLTGVSGSDFGNWRGPSGFGGYHVF